MNKPITKEDAGKPSYEADHEKRICLLTDIIPDSEETARRGGSGHYSWSEK